MTHFPLPSALSAANQEALRNRRGTPQNMRCRPLPAHRPTKERAGVPTELEIRPGVEPPDSV